MQVLAQSDQFINPSLLGPEFGVTVEVGVAAAYLVVGNHLTTRIGDAIHHDGTNHYLYRTYKPGVRQSQIDNLKEKLYFGTATRSDITRITRRLGDEIAKVYGFSIPRQRQAQAAER